MNSSERGIAGEEDPDRGALSLDVLFIYEDLGTALRARLAFEETTSRIEIPADFKVDLCRFDLLDCTEVREAALAHGAGAGLVFISGHGEVGLPPSVEAWLRQWSERKGDQPCALVLSLDYEAERGPHAAGILNFLRELAADRGIQVFPHFGPPLNPEAELTAEMLRQRADMRTTVLEDILGRPYTPPRWDLND